jgi:uncharacterized oligopeptide transporter (OPT) family protein
MLKNFRWDRLFIIFCFLALIAAFIFTPPYLAQHFNPYNMFDGTEAVMAWGLWAYGFYKIVAFIVSLTVVLTMLILLLKLRNLIAKWLTESKK